MLRRVARDQQAGGSKARSSVVTLLGGEVVGLLEVAELVRKQRAVGEGLEHVWRDVLHGAEVGARRVNVALAQLEDAQVGI